MNSLDDGHWISHASWCIGAILITTEHFITLLCMDLWVFGMFAFGKYLTAFYGFLVEAMYLVGTFTQCATMFGRLPGGSVISC